MSLAALNPVGFILVTDSDAARTFYEQTLGLTLISEDSFALLFRMGASSDLMLRVVRVHPDHYKPVHVTTFGWDSPAIETTVDELTARGVVFERIPRYEQDERGIWTAPNGGKVAWFKDPTGNTLSISQQAS